MVVTRNSGLSENFRASKKILRGNLDIKSCKGLRPRVSNPNYREESADEGNYSFFHKILKVDVNNKKSVSHKLKFQSSNRKKTFKEIHRFKLTTSESNNNQIESDKKENSITEFSRKSEVKSDNQVDLDAISKCSKIDEKSNIDVVIDNPKVEINNNNNNDSKKYIFKSNKTKRSFKRRIAASFSRLPEKDNSQKCYESGRRYPSRLRRQPPDVYRVNCSFKNDKKSNWHDSLTSPIHNIFEDQKHRKLELHSKQSDTDDSDGLLQDEIRFEKRKQQSVQRARSELNPINLSKNELKMDLFNETSITRATFADIEPMAIDRSITFNMIGGNKKYIQSLKESVVLPLVYPEVFKKLGISPPRGLLFYGPPGSGKTLLARALVNECSINSNYKLAFFMRKGADCLSKWVGESERQLRLLFDQAYRMRPSIIFFDEIDGLAPVRSVRQDQIHSSIVSTLLSLIDGLDDRGEIIVIGATNRIDSIDPALRRPGRFDREFMFTLPEEKERKDIIKIHTKDWKPNLSEDIINSIASVTKGFSGADIKALVVEAGLCALRRRYPQIYKNQNKLELNLNEIYIKETDFKVAIKTIRPSNERSSFSLHSRLPHRITLLLNEDYCLFKEKITNSFQESVFQSDNSSIDNSDNDLLSCHVDSVSQPFSPFFKPRILVTGFAIEQLISGIFHEISGVNILSFDSLCLAVNNGLSAEEKLCHIFREAEKTTKSIIFLPYIDITFHSLTLSGQNLLLQMVRSHNSNPELSIRTILILTTLSNSATDCWSNVEFDNIQSSHIWAELGKSFQSSVINIRDPDFEQRYRYFNELVVLALKSPDKNPDAHPVINHADEILKEVEVKPRSLNQQELEKLEKEEDNVLRKFRMLLRKILANLVKERKFQVFLNPVDITEVPDYYSIITNPMDLSTMRQKVDLYNYNTFDEFKNDLHLITANALLYNPPRNSYLKDIRRHAYEFYDIAESIFEDHGSPEFDKLIKDIHEARLKRNYYSKIKQTVNNQTEEMREFLVDLNGSKFGIANGPLFRTQMKLFNEFYKSEETNPTNKERRSQSDNETIVKKSSSEIKFKKSKSINDLEFSERNVDNSILLTSFNELQSTLENNTQVSMEVDSTTSDPKLSEVSSPPEPIEIDLMELDVIIRKATSQTEYSTILQLEEIFFVLSKEISKFSSCLNRSILPKNLDQIIDNYFQKT